MRLPFPERISVPVAFAGATVLACLQILQHTSPYFSLYSFLFIVIATVTFNTAGGFTRPSGAYVFFYSVLGVIVGLVYKCYLGEPADSVLHAPLLTIQVFTGGITAMLVAVLVSRKLTRKKPFLQDILKEKDMQNAAVGCLLVGALLILLGQTLTHTTGSALSALGQLNRFLQMSVIIATISAIKRSNGKSGNSGLVILTIGISFSFGAMSFSKEGMITPLVCWLVAACSLRLQIRVYQILLGLGLVYFVFYFLVPYSQYGRNQIEVNATLWERVGASTRLLADLEGVREQYLSEQGDQTEAQAMSYYSKSEGFFDRLTMIGPDDALINYSSEGNYSGVSNIAVDVANWIPHFLWPNKPDLGSGNVFARQIGGIISDEDTTTGISFTPSGEAYHMAGWVGIFLVAPLVWIMLFTLFDSLCGDTRSSPWGLLVIALFSHTAPEGMLDGAIYIMWFGTVGILFVAVTTSYVMPLIGTLFAGPERRVVQRLRAPSLIQRTNPARRFGSRLVENPRRP